MKYEVLSRHLLFTLRVPGKDPVVETVVMSRDAGTGIYVISFRGPVPRVDGGPGVMGVLAPFPSLCRTEVTDGTVIAWGNVRVGVF